ncbi:MAG: hypothetical protein J6B93_05140 [Clostridia bacterium]|nr:hypothetical protein [Clostridia bacterium]
MTDIKKISAVVLALALALLMVFPFGASADEEVSSPDAGFVNVEDFGALGSDQKDDFAAFEAALKTGKNLYVPTGTFMLSKPLIIEDRILRGVGSAASGLRGIGDKDIPIVIVKGRSFVSDLQFSFRPQDIAADEAMGQRVALQVGDKERGLEAGSELRNLFFDRVGTAIYSPAEAKPAKGVLFDTLEVQHYSYRGVDMQSLGRSGNTYSNIYINDQALYKLTSAGFALEGSEFGPVLGQINIEHGSMLSGIIFKNVKGFTAGAIHIEGVAISQNDMGSIYAENSTGYIANLTHILNFIRCYNTSLIRLGDGDGKIVVGNINLRGVNQPDEGLFSNIPEWMEELGSMSNRGLKTPQAKSFVVFERDKAARGDYGIVYENYGFYSYHEDEYDFWQSLPTRGNITVEKYENGGDGE